MQKSRTHLNSTQRNRRANSQFPDVRQSTILTPHGDLSVLLNSEAYVSLCGK